MEDWHLHYRPTVPTSKKEGLFTQTVLHITLLLLCHRQTDPTFITSKICLNCILLASPEMHEQSIYKASSIWSVQKLDNRTDEVKCSFLLQAASLTHDTMHYTNCHKMCPVKIPFISQDLIGTWPRTTDVRRHNKSLSGSRFLKVSTLECAHVGKSLQYP